MSGCSTERQGAAPQTASFDSDHKAIVVLGIASVNEVERFGLLFTTKSWGVIWQPVDPDSGLIDRRREGIFFKRGHCPLVSGINECIPDQLRVQYAAFEVDPGRYVMSAAYPPSDWYRVSELVHFTSIGGGPASIPTARKDIEAGRVRWFDVKAGEVIYLGDFYFQTGDGVVRLVRVDRDAAAASRAIRRFSNITGALAFRQTIRE